MVRSDSPYVWDEVPDDDDTEEPSAADDNEVVIVEGHAVHFNEYRY